METFQELFEETLKDIFYAEKQILKALPKLAKKASSEDCPPLLPLTSKKRNSR